MVSIMCFLGVGLLCRTKSRPALGAISRNRIGATGGSGFELVWPASRLVSEARLLPWGKRKAPSPAARKPLRPLFGGEHDLSMSQRTHDAIASERVSTNRVDWIIHQADRRTSRERT